MTTFIRTSDVTVTTDASQVNSLTSGDELIVTREATLIAAGSGTVVVRATAFTKMTLNGELISTEQVVYATGAGNEISIGPDGYLSAVGGYAAIDLAGGANTVTNAGHIVGSGNAVQAAGNGNYIANTGVMSSHLEVVDVTGDSNVVVNSGTIAGASDGADGILFTGHGNVLRNSGSISGMGDDAVDFESLAGDSNRLVNSGVLVAAAVDGSHARAVSGGDGDDFVINSGLLSGGVSLEGGDDLLDTRLGVVLGDISVGEGADRVLGSALDDVVFGGLGADVLKGFGGHDELFGEDQNDRLLGGDGDDTLDGGDNQDTLTGGAGDDRLSGGAKADHFVFHPGLGHDVIGDFAATGGFHDVIVFSRALFSSFGKVSNKMSEEGPDVLIRVGADTILLANVSLADLDATDFAFVA